MISGNREILAIVLSRHLLENWRDTRKLRIKRHPPTPPLNCLAGAFTWKINGKRNGSVTVD